MEPLNVSGEDGLSEVEEYFCLNAERGTRDYWNQVSRRAFSLVERYFEDIYDKIKHSEGSEYALREERDAVELLEGFAAPVFQYYAGYREEPNVDLSRWMEFAKERGSSFEIGEFPYFNITLKDPSFDRTYQEVQEYGEGEFDQVVGIYSSGLPFLYTAEPYLEADMVVVRYSHRKREDREVLVSPLMEDRLDPEGSDILVVDDVIKEGKTLSRVGGYLLDRGADSVEALVGKSWQNLPRRSMLKKDSDGGILFWERPV